MAAFHKNLAVGITMVLSLVLLGTMIMLFGDAPVKMFQTSQMHVYFNAETAEGLSVGSPILYRGVIVGKVAKIERTAEQTGVRIVGLLDPEPPLPANLRGATRGTLIGGSASLSLDLVGSKPEGVLKDGDVLESRAGGAAVLPPEFAALASELKVLAQELEKTVQEMNQTKLVTRAADAIDTINKTVAKAGETFDKLNGLVGDPKMQADLRATLANFRSVSEDAKGMVKDFDAAAKDASGAINKTSKNIDDLSAQVSQRLTQVAVTLEKFDSVMDKLDKGTGTGGKLVNDPKLYESLVDASRELALTIKDLRRLVQQWEQEGVSFKLGGK